LVTDNVHDIEITMGYGEIKNRREFTAALDQTEDSKNILVIDCLTSWCPQCKAVAPKIDELNKEFGDEKNVIWCVFDDPVAEYRCWSGHSDGNHAGTK
jgi:thiol-disulfide isomerase/thioredoxin